MAFQQRDWQLLIGFVRGAGLYSQLMSKQPGSMPNKKKFFNPFPKYLQLREILRKRMQTDYEVGDRLPTEESLCKEFDVSRETVREALRGFEQEGLIVRHRGQGTFLAQRPEETRDQRLTGLSEDYAALKLDTSSKVLSAGIVTTREISKRIASSSDHVFMVKRVRYFEKKPLALHYAYFTPELGEKIKGIDFEAVSILRLIETTLQIPFFEEKQEIEAMLASPELAQLLEISVGAPVLFLSRFFRMLDTTPLVLFQSYYRADRYYYTLNMATGERKPSVRPSKSQRLASTPPKRRGTGTE